MASVVVPLLSRVRQRKRKRKRFDSPDRAQWGHPNGYFPCASAFCYREGMDTKELQRLGAKRERLRRELAETEERIIDLAVDALREGLPPTEVSKLSGYSHAQLRNRARAAGLPPARPGRKAAA